MNRKPAPIFVLASAIALVITLGGCGAEAPSDEFRDALPSQSQLAMTVPGDESGSDPGGMNTYILGQQAELYALTYRASRDVNGGLWATLKLIQSIAQHPPTSIAGGVATWGPHTGALSPLEWKLMMTRRGPGRYTYMLQARGRDAVASGAQTDFITVLVGASARQLAGPGYLGVLAADSTTLHALDPIGHPNSGKVVATYNTIGLKRRVRVAFQDFSEDGGPLVDALYSYTDLLHSAGSFRYLARTDVHKNNSAEEIALVATNWKFSGEGRGDAFITGGDLPADFTLAVTECWDSSFSRVFYEDNANLAPTEGVKTDCAFYMPLEWDCSSAGECASGEICGNGLCMGDPASINPALGEPSVETAPDPDPAAEGSAQ